MTEIIQIQIGQCGNCIGAAFWETICREHQIDNYGYPTIDQQPIHLKKISSMFMPIDEKFLPRCILIDLEPGTLDAIAAGTFGRLYKPDNMIAGTSGAGNNWAKGHYADGAEIANVCMDAIRKEVELCDCLQGFQLLHSLGGGTGSGLGTLILELLKDEYPDRIMTTYCIAPSPHTSDVVVEPYNTILATNQLIDLSDQCITCDNEALQQICQSQLKLSCPTFKDLNYLVSNAMSGTTCSLRFSGQLNCSLRKLAVNMVPFPRLHFLMVGFSPLHSRENFAYRHDCIQNILREQFSGKNLMCAVDSRQGRFLTCACMIRGAISSHEMEEGAEQIINHNSQFFVDWIPNSVKLSLCDIPQIGMKFSSTFLANSTAISQLWENQLFEFDSLFLRKAFLHWYISEGMSENEFSDAYSNVSDLVSEYHQYDERVTDDSWLAEKS